jgi:hypothetical protein
MPSPGQVRCHTSKLFRFSVVIFVYFIYVICLGNLFIGDWRRRHVVEVTRKEVAERRKEDGRSGDREWRSDRR